MEVTTGSVLKDFIMGHGFIDKEVEMRTFKFQDEFKSSLVVRDAFNKFVDTPDDVKNYLKREAKKYNVSEDNVKAFCKLCGKRTIVTLLINDKQVKMQLL